MRELEVESVAHGVAIPLALGLAELERRLSKGLSLMLSEEKTTLDQWRTLLSIAALDAPTMSELANETCLPNATLTRTVDSLVDDALVFRLASKHDRRRINVYVSEFGRARLDRLALMAQTWERSFSEALGESTVAGLSLSVERALAQFKG